MEDLRVYVLQNLAGTLSASGSSLSFSYHPDYIGPDLSLALPFAQGIYSNRKVRAWFDNLLPDRAEVLAGMAQATGGGRSTYHLLAYYGLDLPGAVQVVSSVTRDMFRTRASTYTELSPAQIADRLAAIVEAENESLARPWTTRNEHWSLGGNQGKIALREHGGRWYSCEGDAPSNTIVKPGVSYLAAQALDECITMRLAERCGLPCAKVRMASFAGVDAIVIERYDRITQKNGAVLRIHQEDLCQALSYQPEKKYAEDGGPSSPQVLALLANASDDSQTRFVDALLFNHLTASTDGHAKNYSILHPAKGSYRLAPLYDVASLAPYMTSERRQPYHLAMGIGGETRVGHLRKTSLQRFARISGIDEAWLFDRAHDLGTRIQEQLPLVLEEPDLAGMEQLDELASRMVPRINALCRTTLRNLSRTGKNYVPANIAKIAAPSR